MAIEIVDFPIKNSVFPWQNVSSPVGRWFTYGKSMAGFSIGKSMAGFSMAKWQCHNL